MYREGSNLPERSGSHHAFHEGGGFLQPDPKIEALLKNSDNISEKDINMLHARFELLQEFLDGEKDVSWGDDRQTIHPTVKRAQKEYDRLAPEVAKHPKIEKTGLFNKLKNKLRKE